jgi:hypothetical protein
MTLATGVRASHVPVPGTEARPQRTGRRMVELTRGVDDSFVHVRVPGTGTCPRGTGLEGRK